MTHAGWLSDVNFWIKDDVGAPGSFASTVGGAGVGAAVGSSGQGFSLTRDEAENLVRRLKGILDDIEGMLHRAEDLTKVKPPAQDPASLTFNRQLVGDGQDVGAFGYGLGHLQREKGYLSELVQRLNEALGRATVSDQAATATLDQAPDGGISGA